MSGVVVVIYTESGVSFRGLREAADSTQAILLLVHTVVVPQRYSIVSIHLSAVIALFAGILMSTSIATFMELAIRLLYAAGAALFHCTVKILRSPHRRAAGAYRGLRR